MPVQCRILGAVAGSPARAVPEHVGGQRVVALDDWPERSMAPLAHGERRALGAEYPGYRGMLKGLPGRLADCEVESGSGSPREIDGDPAATEKGQDL